MSLFSVLSIATSGLAVAQRALSVTANNVANANTEGYTRKVAHQEALVLDGRGAGARPTDATRAVDEFLNVRLAEQKGRLARSEVLSDLYASIQDRILGAPGDAGGGLAGGIGRLAKAAQALADAPDESARAEALVGAAQDLTAAIGRAGAEVQAMRRDVDRQIAGTVAAINDEIRALRDLNGEIARSGADAELLDRRDALLESLAARIEISVTRRENGAIAVYTRGGQSLLDQKLYRLAYDPAADVGPRTAFGPLRLLAEDQIDPATGAPLAGEAGVVLVTGGIRAELIPELASDPLDDAGQRVVSPFRSGRLQGLLEARDRVLPELADQLGELAGLVRDTLNAAHNAAVSLPPPERLTGARTDTGGFAAAARSGTAWLAVIDRRTGATVTTVAVDVGAAASPAALAARIANDLGGYGSASLNASGALEIAGAAGYGIALAEGDSAITVTDSAGHRRTLGFSHYFGLNDLVVPSGAQPTEIAVREDIAADSSRLARAALDVNAGPPPSAKLGGKGDGRGAQKLAAAFETGLATVARGALPAGTYRAADYAAELVSVTAVAAERANAAQAADRALADDLAARQASVSGVNLDEELSRLVLYQKTYAVSARLVSIVDRMLDDLLSLAR
ncbi:flagellar hook-associated protein FlgK [Benzoatithermus flavus]|uniref:Flagellar hook-associated protein 1 n=1 Tax=Benzoatithermus flavus TaxID=3108223 RepID=A0ABU8XXA0_9PROT